MWTRSGALDRIPPRRRDALLAAGLALVLLAAHWPWPARVPGDAAAYYLQNGVAIMAGCALLVWRRRHPLLVFGILAPAFVLALALHVASGPLFVLAWIALYGVPAYATPRQAFVVGLAVAPAAAGVVAYMTTVGPGAQSQGGPPTAILLSAAYVGSAWLLGRYRRTRTAYLAALHERATRLERERDAVARSAAAEERAWIARELHDLLAHTLSGIVVLAGGARRVAEVRPDAAVRALGEIERTGRAGMAETRSLLQALREDDRRAGATLPSLRELPALVDRMRTAGLPVELSVDGAADGVPLAHDLAAYRIAQEALTNTLRHAGAATARVELRYLPDAVELTVTDTGHTDGQGGAPGHGIAGMRERARLLGGDLSAGPGPGRGWTVHARLPLARPAVAAVPS